MLQVGMGGWGRDWAANVLPSVGEIRLVDCVDVSPEALEATRLAGTAPASALHTDLDGALRSSEAEAVLVTTDVSSHVRGARAALESGRHVLVEKPLAPSVSEAIELVELAEKLGLTLMVSQNYRFFPAVRAVQRLVRTGALGRAVHVDIDFRRFSPLPAKGKPLGHRKWPQPLLVDMAIHHFDLLRAVLGQEATAVHCRTWNPPWSGFDDPPEAVATIELGGLTASYRGSWLSPDGVTPWAGLWRIECEHGVVGWTSRGDAVGGDAMKSEAVWTYDHAGTRKDLRLEAMPLVDRAGALDAFASCLSSGGTPETSGHDNLGSLAVAYACVESARRAEIVRLTGSVSGE